MFFNYVFLLCNSTPKKKIFIGGGSRVAGWAFAPTKIVLWGTVHTKKSTMVTDGTT